jgi:signal transduction histidine kinase
MFILGKERIHYVWGLFCLATSVWAGSFYIVTLQNNSDEAHFWWKITYIGIISVPFIFLHFALEFINNEKLNRHKPLMLAGIYGCMSFLLFLNLTSNTIIGGVNFLFNELYYSKPGPFHPYFTGLYFILICSAFYLVYREYNLKYANSDFRMQSGRFMFATLFGFTGASMNFFAAYGIYIHPITNLTAVVGSIIVTDTILRYRLFNMRVVVAQVLAFTLVAITVISLTIPNDKRGLLINIFQTLSTLVVAMYLMLSIRKEVNQRGKIEELMTQITATNKELHYVNQTLEKRVRDQTSKIGHAYEIEKKVNQELKQLNQNKNDFVIITQHHLQMPLAQIRWSVSSMLSGLYGDISSDTERTLNTVNKSAEKLAKVVNSFLDISELKIGTQLLKKSPANLKNILETVIEENLTEIQKRGIIVLIDLDETSWPIINVDMDRMKEVFTILVDNAIRYNKEKGEISIHTLTSKNYFELKISNRGLSLNEADQKSIFKQSFFRTKESKRLNPTGMGVSLLVAKTIIERHGGNIKVESTTEGTSFLIRIPMEF